MTDPHVLYVVANRSGALMYEESKKKKFKFVRRLLNLKGRRMERELVTDRPGRGRVADGLQSHHAYDKATAERQHVAETFAARIAHLLQRSWNEKEFDSLVIAAEPHFLGMLKTQLARCTPNVPTHVIAKEFRQISDRDMSRRLHEELRRTG